MYLIKYLAILHRNLDYCASAIIKSWCETVKYEMLTTHQLREERLNVLTCAVKNVNNF